MLHGKSDEIRTSELTTTAAQPQLAESANFPGVDQAYMIWERPPGVMFYRAKSSFWLPYYLLQGMEFQAEVLTMVFAAEDVIIEGRNLHCLYVELARHTVARIVEQGKRYAALAENRPLIACIERRPHSREVQ